MQVAVPKAVPPWTAPWCGWLVCLLCLIPAFVRAGNHPDPKPLTEAANVSELLAASSVLQIKLRMDPWEPEPDEQEESNGRGIVIAAGGRDMLANALTIAKVLRVDLLCTLPMEIMYHGEEEADAVLVEWLKAVDGVTLTDLATLPLPEHHSKPTNASVYLKKMLALYFCQFDQILYLDADSTPLQNPAFMFEWDRFTEYGALFWPDYVGPDYKESPSAEAWLAFGLEPPWLTDPTWRCTASGQFLLDRRQHADVLEWLLFLNAHAHVTEQLFSGDKDTFEIAFALAGKHEDFHRVAYWPRAALSNITQANKYIHLGILHNTPYGVPAFLHHAGDGGKWRMQNNAAQLLQPVYATLGLSNHARANLVWRDEVKALCLERHMAAQPEHVSCASIDLTTSLILAEHDRDKWEACTSHIEPRRDLPIPLLPLEWFPNSILDTMTSACQAFQAIQKAAQVADDAAEEKKRQEAINAANMNRAPPPKSMQLPGADSSNYRGSGKTRRRSNVQGGAEPLKTSPALQAFGQIRLKESPGLQEGNSTSNGNSILSQSSDEKEQEQEGANELVGSSSKKSADSKRATDSLPMLELDEPGLLPEDFDIVSDAAATKVGSYAEEVLNKQKGLEGSTKEANKKFSPGSNNNKDPENSVPSYMGSMEESQSKDHSTTKVARSSLAVGRSRRRRRPPMLSLPQSDTSQSMEVPRSKPANQEQPDGLIAAGAQMGSGKDSRMTASLLQGEVGAAELDRIESELPGDVPNLEKGAGERDVMGNA